MLLISNNKRVIEELTKEGLEPLYMDVDMLSLLKEARNRIHLGARLLSHPLSGSIKPNESPYKSLLLEEGCSGLDQESLSIIENAIAVTEKFLSHGLRYIQDKREYADYASIDLSLIKSAFANLKP